MFERTIDMIPSEKLDEVWGNANFGGGSKIITKDSPNIAVKVNMDLFKSLNGKLFVEESAAIYHSITHKKCECGGLMEKFYTICKSCREKSATERWQAMETVEWDGKTPFMTYGGDYYFYDEAQLEDYCEENECVLSDLQLVICKPKYLPQIDFGDMFSRVLPDDSEEEPDKELMKKINELNEVIKKQAPIAWSQGNKRVVFGFQRVIQVI